MSTALSHIEHSMSSLDTAMRMLRLLSRERPLLRVGEISRELGVQKSTASRLLSKLAHYGLLAREADGQGYAAGRSTLALAELYLSAQTLLKLVDGALARLVDEFGFVGYAATRSGTEIVILRLVHGRYPLRLVREVGTHLPVWSAALGRALLARLPDAQAWALLKSSVAPGIDRSQALALLANIRSSGVAHTNSAVIPNIAAIGSSVADPVRNEAMGFALSFPMGATDLPVRRQMSRRVREEAMQIGIRLADPFWTAMAPSETAVHMPRRREGLQKRRELDATAGL